MSLREHHRWKAIGNYGKHWKARYKILTDCGCIDLAWFCTQAWAKGKKAGWGQSTNTSDGPRGAKGGQNNFESWLMKMIHDIWSGKQSSHNWYSKQYKELELSSTCWGFKLWRFTSTIKVSLLVQLGMRQLGCLLWFVCTKTNASKQFRTQTRNSPVKRQPSMQPGWPNYRDQTMWCPYAICNYILYAQRT